MLLGYDFQMQISTLSLYTILISSFYKWLRFTWTIYVLNLNYKCSLPPDCTPTPCPPWGLIATYLPGCLAKAMQTVRGRGWWGPGVWVGRSCHHRKRGNTHAFLGCPQAFPNPVALECVHLTKQNNECGLGFHPQNSVSSLAYGSPCSTWRLQCSILNFPRKCTEANK